MVLIQLRLREYRRNGTDMHVLALKGKNASAIVIVSLVVATALCAASGYAADGDKPELSPMGAVVIAMLKAANTGDYVTAKSYCTEEYIKDKVPTPEREKNYWEFRTRKGTLDFSAGKTHVEQELENSGFIMVELSLKYTNGNGTSAGFKVKKVGDAWKVDGNK
jgi:phosphoglycerol transferase MdoB-like AlkP superfamily enzyme